MLLGDCDIRAFPALLLNLESEWRELCQQLRVDKRCLHLEGVIHARPVAVAQQLVAQVARGLEQADRRGHVTSIGTADPERRTGEESQPVARHFLTDQPRAVPAEGRVRRLRK